MVLSASPYSRVSPFRLIVGQISDEAVVAYQIASWTIAAPGTVHTYSTIEPQRNRDILTIKGLELGIIHSELPSITSLTKQNIT